MTVKSHIIPEKNKKPFSVFSPNAGKYGPEKTPYLDTFHEVEVSSNSEQCFSDTTCSLLRLANKYAGTVASKVFYKKDVIENFSTSWENTCAGGFFKKSCRLKNTKIQKKKSLKSEN